jgi:hypothetical protein
MSHRGNTRRDVYLFDLYCSYGVGFSCKDFLQTFCPRWGIKKTIESVSSEYKKSVTVG